MKRIFQSAKLRKAERKLDHDEPIRIYVTASCIRAARTQLAQLGPNKACPIAEAIRRRFPSSYVRVSPMRYLFNYVGYCDGLYLPLTAAMRRKVEAFDAGKRIRPFSFILNPTKAMSP